MIGIARLLASILQMVEDMWDRHKRTKQTIEPDRGQHMPIDPELLARPLSGCDCLRAEHRLLERHADRMHNALRPVAGFDPELEAEVEAIHRVAPAHFEKEQKHLYPRLRETSPDAVADCEAQHQEILALENRLRAMLAIPVQARPATWVKETRAVGEGLHEVLQRHLVREEDRLFRAADTNLSSESQQQMAADIKASVAVTMRAAG